MSQGLVHLSTRRCIFPLFLTHFCSSSPSSVPVPASLMHLRLHSLVLALRPQDQSLHLSHSRWFHPIGLPASLISLIYCFLSPLFFRRTLLACLKFTLILGRRRLHHLHLPHTGRSLSILSCLLCGPKSFLSCILSENYRKAH